MYLRRFEPNKTTTDIDRVLRFLVHSAALHIPAYRKLLGDLKDEPRIRGATDLPLLPVVEKEWLFREASQGERLRVGVDPSRFVRTSTSGYSGMPVTIYMNRAEALSRRLQLLTEWRRFARLPVPLRVADIGSWIKNGAEQIHIRRGPVSIMRISNALPSERQARLLAQHSPHVVSGYPTALAILSECEGKMLRRLAVRLVATRGEVLHDAERTAIQRAFGGRIADFFNCEEIGNVASECVDTPHVLHVNTDSCIVEIADELGHPMPFGKEGRILMTSLTNCTMPFIRYHVGDRGILLPQDHGAVCSCGSARPRLTILMGREDDYVILPDGHRLSPRLVGNAVYRATEAHALKSNISRSITRFQVIQDAADHLNVRIVKDGKSRPGLEQAITLEVQRLHSSLKCTIEPVDQILFEPSGKLKKVVRTFEPH